VQLNLFSLLITHSNNNVSYWLFKTLYKYSVTLIAAPYNGPSLLIELNEFCVYLTIQDPAKPNGIITEYQVSIVHFLTYSVSPSMVF